jgi:hypothetical protein
MSPRLQTRINFYANKNECESESAIQKTQKQACRSQSPAALGFEQPSLQRSPSNLLKLDKNMIEATKQQKQA